jgi:Ca2+-binding RTX toxin-like protein
VRARPMPFRLGIVHSVMGRIVVALLAMQTALRAEIFDDGRADHLPIHDDENKPAPLPGHADEVALRSSGSSAIAEGAQARVKEVPNGASDDSDSEASAEITTEAIDRELPIEASGSSTPPDLLTRPAELSYTMFAGADAFQFVIDATPAKLAVAGMPDFETGSTGDTPHIAVSLSNSNDDGPIITSNGGEATAAVSVNENTMVVTTVRAAHADAGATLNYTIVGGADAFHFVIDPTTGALAFVTAPDFEAAADAGANNVYDVQVQVSDGVNIDTQEIAVTVTDVNDNAPVIASNGGGGAAVVSVNENTTAVTSVTAIDADAGTTLTYSIVGGADAFHFVIDAATGALAFVTAPDFEAPTDAGANNVYDVQVRVSDGAHVDTQDIAVAVTNVAGSFVGTSGNDTFGGTSEEDVIVGLGGSDNLSGGAGADIITGGAGADNLTGGLGADTFVIGAVADLAAGETINGTAEAGTIDTLRLNAAGTYNLSGFTTITNIDAVALNANAAGFNLTLANSQVSTADANGDGIQDDIQISASLAMSNGVTINAAGLTGTNHITVIGTNLGGADTITGGAGTDSIDGGAGNDIITGGTGNDIIMGGAGNDTITGGAGNDTITGGAGADILTGGLGADVFVFNAPSVGTDQILDFSSGEGDQIDILVSGFGGGLTTGTDPSSVFGSSANNTFASGTERFHYNTTTHSLLFDADGNGAGGAQTLAIFNNAALLAASDFHFF